MVVTSCDRHDLLKETLLSFIRVNCGGSKPDRTIIIEDGPTPMPDWLRSEIHYYSANIGKVDWINNEGRRGQIYSIDRAYALIGQEFIFHCEDDWTFCGGGDWLRQSKTILEKYPQIIQVSLRGDSGWHQLIDAPPYEGFKIAMPYWKGGWGGISFNPGLRRRSDWLELGSYGRHVAYGSMGLGHELALSKMLLDKGFRIADFGNRIVEHTGGARSRMKDAIAPMAKVLIAIPVCHSFSYGQWEQKGSDAKDYHFNGDNDRVQALRDTWLKDVAAFPNVTVRLFYGKSANAYTPKEDEVILGCGDDYKSLPAKTIAICKYAQEHNYDLVFKCDDDTGVYVDRILQESMEGTWDYAGYLNGRVCTGGTGYWLTRRSVNVIADHATANYHWAEDVTVSHYLFHHNIQGVHLAGHRTGRQDHWFWKDGFDPSVNMDAVSSFHAVRPSDMRAWYETR